MVPKQLNIRSLATMLSVSSLLLLLLPAGGSASTPAPAPPAPPARVAKNPPPPPAPPADPDSDSDDQDHPKRGWLGVFLSEDEDEDEVVITGVKDGSPAAKAGLKEGDKIVEIDSKKVDDSTDIRNVIRQLEPGDTVQVVVMRDGKRKSVNATLGEAPKNSWGGFSGWAPGEGFGSIGFPGMGMSKTYLGVQVQGMTEDLRAYFKAPRGRGVLVSRVNEDTPAGKAGLRAGDVIIAVDGRGIANRGDIGAALADKEPGDTVAVKIVRDGSEKTLDVEVEERPTPKARHGMFYVPDEEKGLWIDEDGEEDLEELHDHEMDAVPDNSRFQLEMERAMREAHRAMRNSGEHNQEIHREIRRAMQAAQEMAQVDVQRQIQQELARVQDSVLLQKEEVRRQVEAAMDQAREAMREAAEAAQRAEESSGI